MLGLGAHYELVVTCKGTPDARTGYFLDIKRIDAAARTTAIPAITRTYQSSPETDPASVLAGVLGPLNVALGGTLDEVCWMLSPTYGVSMSPASPSVVLIRQRFEIAAAHRLHVPTMSNEENRRVFGKCNNPSGHGHNYIIEPVVAVTISPGKDPAFTLADLERITHEALVEPFDHKNLSVDVPVFAGSSGKPGLSPSVENISRVFYETLAPRISAHTSGVATLRSITVFETEKTSSTYPG